LLVYGALNSTDNKNVYKIGEERARGLKPKVASSKAIIK